MLLSEIEIITDRGRRRRWSAAEKLRILEETLDKGASISVVARRNGAAANPIHRWRHLMLDGGARSSPQSGTGSCGRKAWRP